ncbi:phosphatase PAP2 family protein [Lacticaseibacillus pabuli]|uniref:Phosphatase PAP2 family protein n=1 Tax=Lacticaseibacillus pabuli TaxID=3025672 RepID=A0ABY7WPB2_9LACO|nr:phosphatase PAP2 family protein [Lacticaseibacillus sp. KACC 23028]WDF82037.1 phosphatase PAP2 family protein [Lacticaseibacillus sp. KACC 23028]
MLKRNKLICAVFAAAILGLLMFGVLTNAGYIHAIDNAGIALIVHHGAWNPVVIAVTNLGNPPVITAFAVMLALYFLIKRRYRVTVFIATNMIVVNLANFIVKNIVQRQRPFIQDPSITPLVHAGGFSFPSGHSAGAVLLYGTIFLLAGYLAGRPKTRRLLRGFCLLMILLIGASRIYVQVHFPTDVLAGYALGTCGLMLSWAITSLWMTKDGLPERLKDLIDRP